MSLPIRLRRPFVVAGVILSLLLGAATIRAAANWTAASSPLAAKPPSVETLQAAVVAEQERSAALRAQLDELTAGSSDLTAALDAARTRIAADADQARALQASLQAAKAKLATLEASIRRARSAVPRTTAAPTAPAAATVAAHDDDGEPDDGG